MTAKPKCLLTVDVEALPVRASGRHVDSLIYGRFGGEEWGIGRMMDIADRHGVKMSFFLDFAEVERYGDEIIGVGKYIASRGHDLQIHCHYDLLRETIRQRFPHSSENYHVWYDDDELSGFIVDYCLEQYRKCAANPSVVFRGGEYRFGRALLEKLKEHGVAADASYNMLRPRQLPVNHQFAYENGLLELPVGVLPEENGRRYTPLNFNLDTLYPKCRDDVEGALDQYDGVLRDFYHYYGDGALASMLMHSWSFCFDKARFQDTRYIDKPNPWAAELFDRFLEQFSGWLDFITAAEAVQLGETYFTKKVDFDAIFSMDIRQDPAYLRQVVEFVREKAGGRKIVAWGTGLLERQTNEILDFNACLSTAFYIARNAESVGEWRGKPVKTFEEARLSPKEHYVLMLVKPSFSEVRGALEQVGFAEFHDFFDINKPVPLPDRTFEQIKKGPPCPICGGDEYALYNSNRPRRCERCGSVERNRTIPKLFAENLGMELLSKEILHVSPTRSERLFFRQTGAANITTLDVRPQVKPDIVADLCNMPQVESESFDVVFANCVLNHVYDDEAALSEIHRVLRSKGLFIVWVMGSGSRRTTVDADPTEWYGQEAMEAYRVGTYRHYGETDFTAQLRRYFAKVRSYEKYDAPSGRSCCWYVCEK